MNECVLKGPPCKLPEIEKGIGELFFEHAEKFGDRVFQIDAGSGKQETYNDVKRRSTRVAIYLQSIGIKPKDVVLLCCINNLDNVIPVLATLYLGAYVASVDPKHAVSEVKYTLEQVEPKVVFVEKNSLDLIKNSLRQSNQKPSIIVIGSSLGIYPNMLDIENNDQGETYFRPLKVTKSDIAAILLSSGTTSTPKGIYVSHFALINIAQSLSQHNTLKPEVLFKLTSFVWISAWWITAVSICTAGTQVIASSIGGEQFLQIVEKYKVTSALCSTVFTFQITNVDEARARKYDTSSLFAVITGGAVLDPKQILKLRHYVPHANVNLAYGSTEANFLTSHNLMDPKTAKEKVASSGTLLPGVQMKFVDSVTGRALGPNQEGEIRVKSKFLMAGYHNLSKPDIFDEEGFFKVGDIGYYDEDGHVYVTDRIDEMFKYQTFQISPATLESVLLRHPAVKEAVVFGVPHKIDRNHPAACVVLKSKAIVTGDEIISYFNKEVSDAQQLRGGLAILESMPLTATGKHHRKQVKEDFIKVKAEEI